MTASRIWAPGRQSISRSRLVAVLGAGMLIAGLLATPALAWTGDTNTLSNTAILRGTAAADSLTITTSSGYLTHSAWVQYPAFESPYDWDSSEPGEQFVPAAEDMAVTIAGDGGGDLIVIDDSVTRSLSVLGGPGNDFIFGGSGPEYLAGGDGHDYIEGGRGADEMRGGEDNDTFVYRNGHGSEYVAGSPGNDVLEVNGALNLGDHFVVRIVDGTLRIARTNLGLFTVDIGDVERISVNGWGGDDTLVAEGNAGERADLTFQGNVDADTLRGASGRQLLQGGESADEIFGGDGKDSLNGGGGRDLLSGGDGDDVIDSRDDVRDDVRCGSGRDRVLADSEDDLSGCEAVSRG